MLQFVVDVDINLSSDAYPRQKSKTQEHLFVSYLDVLPDCIDDHWSGLCVDTHKTCQSRIKFVLRRLKIMICLSKEDYQNIGNCQFRLLVICQPTVLLAFCRATDYCFSKEEQVTTSIAENIFCPEQHCM